MMKAAEWVGRKVRLKKDIENKAGGFFSAGTVMVVARKFGGLNLRTLSTCEKCRCKGWDSIKGVSMSDAELPEKVKL
ncbi:MAG: hypothetical protein HY894_00370 [Deltaproteobacteria bacterium]|nr:hypothetical protein [Deltaproteobacteria bacterium]